MRQKIEPVIRKVEGSAMPSLMGENCLFSDRDADMKRLGGHRDTPHGIIRVRSLVTHGNANLEVLEN